MKDALPEISIKSTKDQILGAYNEVLKKLNEKNVERPQEVKKKEQESKIVMHASNHSAETLLSDLSQLKLKAMKQIEGLSDNLLEEFKKLEIIRQAISLEQKHLQDLYQINETTNTLAALLQTQQSQKERFLLEIEEKKKTFQEELSEQQRLWKVQKEQLEKSYKEQKDELEKSRKREEEEYKYIIENRKRKDQDDYQSKRSLLEKELAELKNNLIKREEQISEKEHLFQELGLQVEQFSNRLQVAVEEAKNQLREQIMQQTSFESQLKQKEFDGSLQLNKQKIDSLEGKIKEQDTLIRELTQKADHATQQVQSIACRALDTSSKRFVYQNPIDEK